MRLVLIVQQAIRRPEWMRVLGQPDYGAQTHGCHDYH